MGYGIIDNYCRRLIVVVGVSLNALLAARAQTPTSAPSAPVAPAVPAVETAPAAAPAGSALPDGFWKGPLKVPGGQLEVIFRTVKLSGGAYFATLDVPQQKVSRMAVTVLTTADTVRFFAEEANSRFIGRLAADGLQISGTWQQPGFRTALTLVLAAAPAPAALARNARLTPPYREEQVAFSGGAPGLRLGGELTLPPGAGPFPAVVLLSDAGPQDRDGTMEGFATLGRLADYLTRRGIAVLRFDDRGVGKSAGTTTELTPAELTIDARGALNYLRARPEIDQKHLGLIGHGEGGNVALLLASQPEPPAFVVTLAAAGLPGAQRLLQQRTAQLRAAGATGTQVAVALKTEQAILEAIRISTDDTQAQATVADLLRQRNAALTEAAAKTAAAGLTSPRLRQLLTTNPLARLTAVSCPVLLLHGAADLNADADANLTALSKGLLLNKKNVEVKKLAGVNHLFQPEAAKWPLVNGQPQPNFSPEAAEAIRGWIVARTKK